MQRSFLKAQVLTNSPIHTIIFSTNTGVDIMKIKDVAPVILLLLVVLSVAGRPHRQDEREREREREEERQHRRYFEDLEPRQPRQQIRSEGGQTEEWRGDEYRALQDANLAAIRVTLNPRGLLLPAYIDNHAIKVVLAGTARVGLVLPVGDRAIHRHVYRVEKGDVVAIPRGVPSWWYNDGDERTEIVGIADTAGGEEPGRVQPFFLAGAGSEEAGRRHEPKEGRRYRSVLHGFDEQILARAWDVDEETARRIVQSQSGSGVVQVREGMKLPDVTAEAESESGNPLFASFVYRLARSDPDLRVQDGGELRIVNRYKLPVLRHLGLSLTCAKLEQNSMVAPSWSVNSHKILYFVRGSGRVQIVRQNGERAVDAEVREGSLLVVPRFFPVVTVAGKDGLDYLSVHTSDVPLAQYLAGRNSVFKGMPVEVVARAFQIDEELERKVRERRTDHGIILPSSSSEERRRRRERSRPEHDSGVAAKVGESIIDASIGFHV